MNNISAEHYKTVLECTKSIESILSKYFEAEGKGLHGKLNNASDKLSKDFSDPLKKKIRWLATIRNNLVHNEDFEFNEAWPINQVYGDIVHELENIYCVRNGKKNFPEPLELKPAHKISDFSVFIAIVLSILFFAVLIKMWLFGL